jgi:hypothetical protein
MANDIEQLLINESGRIGPDIYRKTLNTSPWLKLIQQDTWPDEMGDTISVLTYERSLYDQSGLTWSNVSITGGSNCVPAAEEIGFAQTLRSYNLQHTALESPEICVNDLRFTMKRKEQLSNIFEILKENTAWAWQNRYRDEYVRVSEHKIVAKANGATLYEGTASFPTQQPTSRLTQGILDRIYLQLVRDGAGNKPMGRQNGRPEFTIICSPETSDQLLRDDDSIRQDYRWNPGKVNELLAPLGVDRSFRGFYHLIDMFPKRWNFVSNAWVEVYPYVAVVDSDPSSYLPAGQKGTKFVVNPAYETAAYEDTVVFHQDVYTSLIPAPISSPGGNTSFDPVSYRGDFKWKNIPNKQTNPDGTIGYFRGVLSNGTKPLRPEWGYVIRHLRCAPKLGLVDCAGAAPA